MERNYPQKPGLELILKQAYYYWSKTLAFQLIFSIMYFGIMITAMYFFAGRFGIYEYTAQLQEAFAQGTQAYLEKSQELGATENMMYFTYALIGTSVFLYPLNIGFFQIYRKMDLGEVVTFNDLLVGYNGFNFFRYISYFVFWILTYLMIAQTLILPIVWVMGTLFVAPLMFFQNKRIFEGMALNFKALKMFFVEILVAVLIAFFFKYLGFMVFLVGGLFTFPFWNAMIYALYRNIFVENS